MKIALSFLLVLSSLTSWAADGSMTVHVEGMTCPSCAASIEKQFKKIPGVSSIDINIRKGTVVLAVQEGRKIPKQEIEKAVKEAGYKVKSIE